MAKSTKLQKIKFLKILTKFLKIKFLLGRRAIFCHKVLSIFETIFPAEYEKALFTQGAFQACDI